MCNRDRGFRFGAALLAGAAFCWLLVPTILAESAPIAALPRERALLDADWAFYRGEVPSRSKAVSSQFDDRQWQQVRLPHDFILDGTYAQTAKPADPTPAKIVRNHGYLPLVVGWYRRHLFIPASARGKILRLDFDGVFRDSEVWVNGQRMGRHASGYTPFSYDITAAAKLGADNVIAVRVDPRETEGWWYEGGGIYRHVYLTTLAPVHAAHWGVYVMATVPHGDEGAAAEADLTIQTSVENGGSDLANCSVVSEIVSPDGNPVLTVRAENTVAAGGRREVVQSTVIRTPRLWSLRSPQLYLLRTTILREGTPVDATTTTFGIRTIRFDANRGFFLNGRHVEIYGLACHQDFAAVGIAVPDSLQPWRVEQLKQAGCNAWRTAHNPPNEAVLDACDRLGMLVMDENRHLGDTYAHPTPAGTTATDLSDLATMIQRDRNHPSVIMWSMCNEEKLQGKPEGAALFSAMMQVVHRYDRTRPITSAMNGGWLAEKGIADVEDIIGVNYNTQSYDAIHRRHPDKALFGSEDTNQKTTRGEYADNRGAGLSSGYNLSDKDWRAVAERPFFAGSFTWTGIDYKGEPNPYGWPDVSNNTGLMDACGFPKDKYYYFQSCWTTQPMVHVVPDSWNWPDKRGQSIRVIAFSNARQVEIFLNGRSLGLKDVPRGTPVEWQVPYEPGQLLAKAYTGGATVATEDLETTGAPARVELAARPRTMLADGSDTIVVPVSIVDGSGRIDPTAVNRVSFQLAGGGKILGVGNGDPADHDPDRAEQRNAFHGRCIVIIQSGLHPATLQLSATSPGLAPSRMAIEVK